MALELTKELDMKVTANYWKLSGLELPFDDSTFCILYFALYLDKAAADAGGSWFEREGIEIDPAVLDLTKDLRPQLYTIIKKLSMFKDATDV